LEVSQPLDFPDILQDEFEMNLRLLGAPTIKDVVPAMVDATNIHSHIVAVPHDQLYNANCTRLSHPPVRGRINCLLDENMQHARLIDVKAKTKL
jgi:L-lactate dehydrogenase (cytochrome)